MALSFEGETYLYSNEICNEIARFGGRQVTRSIASSSTLGRIIIIRPLDSSGEKVERMIYNAIARNPNIRSIDVLSRQVTLTKLYHALLSRMRHLKELRILSCNNADGVVSSEIAAILRSNRQLEKLFIGGDFNAGDAAAEGIAQALLLRSSLQTLELQSTNLTVTGVVAVGRILQQCLSLSIFKISELHLDFDVAAAVALAEGITRSSSLKELIISVRSIPRAAGCLILDSLSLNRTLTKVLLPQIELGHDGSLSVAHLIEGDNAIESLILNDRIANPTSQTTLNLAPIVRALPFNRTLKYMKLGNMRLRMDGMQGLLGTNMCNSSLEKLRLWSCHFEVVEDSALFFHVFFKLVAALKSLSLRYCRFEDDVFVPLCDALKLLSSLEELELNGNGNNIEDGGAFALAPLLMDSRTLRRLDVGGNDIAEEGVRALLDSFRLNYSLTELSGVATTKSQTGELQFYLDRNKGPARLMEATVPLALWPHALSHAACYQNEPSDEDDSDSESNEAEDIQQCPDMLYFLVRERCDEIFRNVPTQNGRRRKRKRKGYRGRRSRRRGG